MDCRSIPIEEIPRRDLALPQMRLKIISLNLNDRGYSVSTPSPPTQSKCEKTLLPYVHKPLVLKKTHKLRSFEHMLQAIDDKPHTIATRENSKDIPNGNISCNGNCSKYKESSDKESQTEDIPKGNNDSTSDFDSTYIIFIRGMNNAFSADKEEVINTIVNMLNKHVVSVSSKEHKLFSKTRKKPSKSCINHILMKGALLTINELMDEGLVEITPTGVMQIAQGVTFAVCFHKTLLQFAKDIWNSRHAEFIRDAWMSFGGLAAVLVMSATRQ